jgi:GNAT superfamily N-acetyltransferase
MRGDGQLLLGTVDGAIVALGGLVRRDRESGVVTALRVHPDHQGRGYGAAILGALEAGAQGRGYRLLFHYADARQTGGRRLFERRGWTMVDRASYGPDAEVVRYRKRV